MSTHALPLPRSAKLLAAVFCEEIAHDPETGKPSLLRLLDGVAIAVLDEEPSTPQPTHTFWTFVWLDVDGLTGTHSVAAALRSPSDDLIAWSSLAKLDLRPGDPPARSIEYQTVLTASTTPRGGIYRLEISFDGHVIGGVPLRIDVFPEPRGHG